MPTFQYFSEFYKILYYDYQLFFYKGVFNVRGNWDYCRIVLYFNSFVLNLHIN